MDKNQSWLSEAVVILPGLFQRSLDVTLALSDAVKSVHKANEISHGFVRDYFSSETLEAKESPKITEEENLFISVVSSLGNDGTFWCKHWTSSSSFDGGDMQAMSDELGWMEKELTVQEAVDYPVNRALFYYSSNSNLYFRVTILKHSVTEKNTTVRYLDYGNSGEISSDTVFYYLPAEIESRYPYKSMYGTILTEESLSLPYEAKWRFRDLTSNRVLMARILRKIEKQGLICHVLEMKTLVDEELNINREVLKKFQEHQVQSAEMKKVVTKDKESSLVEKGNEEKSIFKKPIPPVAAVEPVQQSKKDVKKDIRKVSVGSRSKTPDLLQSKSRSNERDKSKSRNNSCSDEYNILNNSSSALSSFNISNQGRGKIRSNSYTNLPEKLQISSSMYHSTDSISPAAESHAKTKQTTKVNKMHQEFYNAVKKHSESNKANIMETLNVATNTDEKIKNQAKQKKLKKNVEKIPTEIKQPNELDEYWVDLIPIKERERIHKFIPNLANIFYSATKLRSESWQDIELKNIQKLLHTQATVKFFYYDVTNARLLTSFKNDSYLELPKDAERFLDNSNKTSQYLILRKFNGRGAGRKVIGIAKVESTWHSGSNRYPVTYLSLSIPTKVRKYWMEINHYSLAQINNSEAKAIIEVIKDSLECRTSEPLFPAVYPWCGIPPLIELSKPKLLKFRDTRYESNPKDSITKDVQIDIGKIMSSEVWDLDSEAEAKEVIQSEGEFCLPLDSANFAENVLKEAINVRELEKSPKVQNSVLLNTDADNISKAPVRILKRQDSVSNASPQTVQELFSNMENISPQPLTVNAEVYHDAELQQNAAQIHLAICEGGGYYDQSGMWYPTIEAAKVNLHTRLNQLPSTTTDEAIQNLFSSAQTSGIVNSTDVSDEKPAPVNSPLLKSPCFLTHAERKVVVLDNGVELKETYDHEKHIEKSIESSPESLSGSLNIKEITDDLFDSD